MSLLLLFTCFPMYTLALALLVARGFHFHRPQVSARARGPPIRPEQAAGARHSGRRRGRTAALRPRAPRAQLAPRLAAGRHAARSTAGAVREARATPEQRPRAPSTAGLLSALYLPASIILVLQARKRFDAMRCELLFSSVLLLHVHYVTLLALHLELVCMPVPNSTNVSSALSSLRCLS